MFDHSTEAQLSLLAGSGSTRRFESWAELGIGLFLLISGRILGVLVATSSHLLVSQMGSFSVIELPTLEFILPDFDHMVIVNFFCYEMNPKIYKQVILRWPILSKGVYPVFALFKKNPRF